MIAPPYSPQANAQDTAAESLSVTFGIDDSEDWTPPEARVHPKTVRVTSPDYDPNDPPHGGGPGFNITLTQWEQDQPHVVHVSGALTGFPSKNGTPSVAVTLQDPVDVRELERFLDAMRFVIAQARAGGLIPPGEDADEESGVEAEEKAPAVPDPAAVGHQLLRDLRPRLHATLEDTIAAMRSDVIIDEPFCSQQIRHEVYLHSGRPGRQGGHMIVQWQPPSPEDDPKWRGIGRLTLGGPLMVAEGKDNDGAEMFTTDFVSMVALRNGLDDVIQRTFDAGLTGLEAEDAAEVRP